MESSANPVTARQRLPISTCASSELLPLYLACFVWVGGFSGLAAWRRGLGWDHKAHGRDKYRDSDLLGQNDDAFSFVVYLRVTVKSELCSRPRDGVATQIRGFFPFDWVQRQNDNFKEGLRACRGKKWEAWGKAWAHRDS
jgi:hypothetical protein